MLVWNIEKAKLCMELIY